MIVLAGRSITKKTGSEYLLPFKSYDYFSVAKYVAVASLNERPIVWPQQRQSIQHITTAVLSINYVYHNYSLSRVSDYRDQKTTRARLLLLAKSSISEAPNCSKWLIQMICITSITH